MPEFKVAEGPWFVYVLRVDGRIVYVGCTVSPINRFAAHTDGISSVARRLSVKSDTLRSEVLCGCTTRKEAITIEAAMITRLRGLSYQLANIHPRPARLMHLLRISAARGGKDEVKGSQCTR